MNKIGKTGKIITAVVSAIVIVAAIALLATYLITGRNMQAVSLKKYVIVNKAADSYTVVLDYDALVEGEHLPSATNPDSSKAFNERDYPELEVLKNIVFIVTPSGEANYQISYAFVSDMTAEQIAAIISSAGLRLVDTSWTWSAQAMDTAYQGTQDYPRTIDVQQFLIVIYDEATQSYSAGINTEGLLKACGFDTLPETDSRVATIKSLGFLMDKTQDGYRVSLCSTNEKIEELLLEARINLTNRVRELRADQLLNASTSTPAVGIITPAPSSSIEPTTSAAPSASASPSQEPTNSPSPTPTQNPTTPTPSVDTNKEGCITSLYGYNQTPVRKAIRTAKTNYYSTAFKESEVVYNYFIVGKTDTAEYANCFRLVLEIKTSGGTEYMVADVYNLKKDTEPKSSEVVIKTYTSKSSAKGTADFNSSLYTVYTLDGGSMVFSENSGTDPFNSDGLVFKDSLDTKLTDEQLWNIPATSSKSLVSLLGYARNEIFARCGHKFKDGSTYYQYFKQFDWYKPTGEVVFNDIEARYSAGAKNIEIIKEIEKLIKLG